MEIITIVLYVVGGGIGVKLLDFFWGRRGRFLQNRGMENDQIGIWLTRSLQLSEQAVDMNSKFIQMERELSDCQERMEDCDCHD